MNALPKWNAFLNSLATRGGAIFVLLTIVVFVDGGSFVVYLRHDMDAHALLDVVGSGAIIGALLLALKGSSDSTATATSNGSGSTQLRVSDSGGNADITKEATSADTKS